MRAACLVASLAVAVVLQVSVLNGLLLPGGGVPDLVLILVCALAMASGPVNGAVIGFAAGLSLDLAPPGSTLVGQYALVFCLAGWAAGRLRPVPGRTAWKSAGLIATTVLGLVVAGGEVASAAVAKVVTPSAVTMGQLRLVLPSSIAYDLILCPFVLFSVMLASTLLAQRSAAAEMTSALAGTARSRRTQKRAYSLPELHLGKKAARAGDGWVGSSRPAGPGVAVPRQRSRSRLHPAAGVPGSATGLRFERSREPSPVHLHLSGRSRAGRRGDGAVGPGLAGSRLGAARPGGHPVTPAGGSRHFRPHVDRPAVPAQARRTPAPVSFAGHRGDGSLGQTLAPGRPARTRPRSMSFARHRGDGSFGQTLAGGRPTPRSPGQPAIHFGSHPFGSSSGAQPRMGGQTSGYAAATVPRLRFASNHVPAQRRAPAEPRFRRGPAGRTASVIVPGGVLGESTLRARRQQAAPRLRLSRVPPGMLGGSGRPLLARSRGRAGKQPRFSYGKRRPMSMLTRSRVGRRMGGRWLARRQAGSRAGVWLLGRRTGRPR
jgi:rod shape-determining protein MreD